MPLHRVRAMNDYRALYQWSITEPEAFWQNEAQRLDWFHPPQQSMSADMHEVSFSWFAGGRLNASYNCIDRHLKTQADKVAIVWAKNEPGSYVSITYRQLSREVGRIANVLKSLGIRKGDTVCLYMPMIPELAYTMLACSRIGAIHSVVFAGFSAEALRDRILDAHSKVVVTANVALRGSKTIDLKSIVDHAVEGLSFVETVLVARRTEAETPMHAGRDQWLADAMAKQRPVCPAEWMDAEDPLFILYTSGSTGKPKGVLHTTGGYLCYSLSTFNYVFDLRSNDIHFCTADLGWITGHSYILYAPLAAGITTVLFESIPTFPDASRYWQVCDDVRATICYTAPTALRTLMREGDAPVKASRRDSLRILGTVGEPINPEVWRWYSEVVGEGRCPIVDTWWQTETGGILISPLAGVTPTKPGSATLPMFGVKPVLVDDQGKVLSENAVNGNLCLALAWPGMARTLYGDHARFEKTYFRTFENLYFTGDGCRRDEDGYYWITGRVDDVLNVSGHRIGTAEVESALVAHEWVAEAAVVGYPHEIKGQGICAWVHTLPLPDDFSEEELVGALKLQVRHAIGAIATPDRILIVQGLPKTRSGKIMRRILRKIAEGQTDSLGDLSTLADPSVVEDLIRIAL